MTTTHIANNSKNLSHKKLTTKKWVKISGMLLISSFALSGCDKLRALTQKTIDCSDPASLERLETEFHQAVLSDTKAYLARSSKNANAKIDIDAIKSAINQLKVSVDDIRTEKTESASTKTYCAGTLNVNLSPDLIARVDVIRQKRGEASVKDLAFKQDVNLVGSRIQQAMKYTTQPTDDGKKSLVELIDMQPVTRFVASVVVDGSGTAFTDLSPAIASQVAPSVASVTLASVPAKTVSSAPKPDDNITGTGPAAGLSAPPVAEDGSEGANEEADKEIQAIAAEQARVKAKMDFKRREFNQLWNSASPEAQESLLEDQKQWVAERDETCLAKAQEAEAVRQEIVRMTCITDMLSERYYEVKKYFDNYE